MSAADAAGNGPASGTRLALPTRISLLLASLVLVTAIVVAALIFGRYYRLLTEHDQSELEREADLVAIRLGAQIEELEHDLRFLSGTPPIQGLQRSLAAPDGVDPMDGSTELLWRIRLETIFTSLLASKEQYAQARYIGLADGGLELVRADRFGQDGAVRVVRGEDLQRKGERNYVQEGAASPPGTPWFSDVELNREHGQIVEPRQTTLRAVQPVPGPDGAPYGVVVLNVDMDRIFGQLQSVLGPERALTFRSPNGLLLGEPLRTTDDLVPAPRTTRSLRFGADDRARVLVEVVDLSPRAATVSRAVARQVLLAVLAMLALAAAAGVWAARRITEPIVGVSRVMAATRFDDKRPDFPPGLTGEAALVADAFSSTWRELQRRKGELEASNRELRQFAYVASHDLQEPLRTVTTFIDLLDEEQGDRLDEEGREFLGFIRRAAGRMSELIHGLLEYSRIGKVHVDEDVDLAALSRQVLADLGTRIADCEGRVEVGDLPLVRGHAATLRTLLQNLIGNGLKFARPGVAPVVRLSAERHGSRWQVLVDDNGIGIGKEHRERVFLIFQRLHARQEYEGSGIGLAQCKKIIEVHGGTIEVDDSPLGGCRISFDLEVAQ